MEIKNKKIIISGASSGIGAATAKALAKRGAHVLLLARTQEALEIVTDKIQQVGGTAAYYVVDMSQADEVSTVAQYILNTHGTPDVVINNAGAGRWLAVDETEPQEVVQMTAVPYFAAFWLTHAFLPGMLERHNGHIINMTSVAAYISMPGTTAYSAARWAMRGFSKCLAGDVRNSGIRVTLLAPGKVSSSYFDNNPGSQSRIPKIDNLYPSLTPQQVSNSIVKIIEQGKQGEVVIPLMYRLSVWMQRLFPSLVDWPVTKTGWQRKN